MHGWHHATKHCIHTYKAGCVWGNIDSMGTLNIKGLLKKSQQTKLLILMSEERKNKKKPQFALVYLPLFQLNNGLVKCSYHYICQDKKVKLTSWKHHSTHICSAALLLTKRRLEHASFLFTGPNGLDVWGIHKSPEIIFVVTSIQPQP